MRSLVRSAVQSSAQHKNGSAPSESSPSSSAPTNSKPNPHSSNQNRADKTNLTASKSKPAASADTVPPIHVEKHASRPKEFAHLLHHAAPPQRRRAGRPSSRRTLAGKASILSPVQ
ncbi:hypothetical protein DFH08DRAFT_975480 [Mycena albidolilacea]|uniref:Uncharacterized protein n=1 Tax=Mycena albidolilacea TaxID=1033008 RepID=A0AAD7EB50_9AGAR|nr:hypothetical protein DFH08DRAFT_975480 [Mycena albidolilacea]